MTTGRAVTAVVGGEAKVGIIELTGEDDMSDDSSSGKVQIESFELLHGPRVARSMLLTLPNFKT